MELILADDTGEDTGGDDGNADPLDGIWREGRSDIRRESRPDMNESIGETLTHRMLIAAASKFSESPLTLYQRTLDRPEALQVKCTQVEATEYGLVRLVLGEDGRSPAVAVRQELVIAVLYSEERLPVGFLSD